MESTKPNPKPYLHSLKTVRGKAFNHGFTLAYALAILALFYHHIQKLLQSHHFCFTNFSMLIADLILAVMWCTTIPFRINPVIRQVFPENIENVLERNKQDFPALDIFICTADPYKEPPLRVVNTALSVMAYDYPTDKLSIYVSDDGGSQLTLFAFMEAVDFAKYWIPFCKQNNIIQRSPDAYFMSNYPTNSEHDQIKMMYEKMKIRIENVVEQGKLTEEYITNEQEHQVFRKWTQEEFTRQQHPSVIQVLSEVGKNNDIQGNSMPNLIYVSREKSEKYSHHYKAGAQNVLLRVSAVMTNAPIILTLDCDMLSNDPLTPHRMLCFFLMQDSVRPAHSRLGHVQFPQRFHGLNKDDIYASELKRLFTINPMAMDGLKGPYFVGTGCFFWRRVFFGGPSSSSLLSLQSQIPELRNLDHVVDKPISSKEIINLAYHVSSCNYEHQTDWGSKLGFRYGSMVEDYFTSYRIHCEGWESVLCNPERSAFLGDTPITLNEVLGQNKRWSFGLLEVAFSKYSPLTFGVKSSMGFSMALAYAHFAFSPFWFIPIAVYSFLPQLTLLNKTSIFPKVGDLEFFLYAFLFLGSYVEDCIGFVMTQGTFKRWWSDQRMWLMRGLSSFTFGTLEYVSKRLGIFSIQGFNVTNKAVDDGHRKRYDQGKFEFGSQSVIEPMFVPLAMAAIINLLAFVVGLLEIIIVMIKGGVKWDELFLQMFITGFGILNSMPIYKAMVFRSDNGKMSTGTTGISLVLTLALLVVSSYLLNM